MKKILFICSKNKLRSPTAEIIFSSYENLETRSAGVNNDAEIKLGAEDVQWADIIFVMEQVHKRKLIKKFADYIKTQKIICLGIKDNYEFMEPELVKLLKQRVLNFLH